VDLGALTGTITVSSHARGFKFDRIFITPDKSQAPVGRGFDYQPSKAFEAVVPEGVAAKELTPFAAEVTWKPVSGARYYNIYASDKADFAPAQANLLYSPPAGSERVIDWGLKPGSTTVYRVVAVDFDGTVSKPAASAEVKTEPVDVKTAEMDLGKTKGGVLDREQTWDLKFSTAAEGDYVFWYSFRVDDGRPVRMSVTIDGKKYTVDAAYDLSALGGKALKSDFVWSKFIFLWTRDGNGIQPLKPGEHTISISTNSPIQIDKLIITNDQSLVPAGKLCTF